MSDETNPKIELKKCETNGCGRAEQFLFAAAGKQVCSVCNERLQRENLTRIHKSAPVAPPQPPTA